MIDPYEFDSQTQFKDTPRSRYGLPWEAWELNKLRSLYLLGYTLQRICDLMERPKAGVLPKLANLGLIQKETTGYFWIWKRKVLPDAWKVGTKPEKPRSNPLKIYPDLANFVDDLENSVFKDAILGVTTLPNLSGLGISTSGTTNSTQLNPQTKPKEPTMKFETRTFVNDVDASTMTDDQIFGEIRRAEKRIEELKAIKTPTKKLVDNIAKLEEYAANLAKYVDSR